MGILAEMMVMGMRRFKTGIVLAEQPPIGEGELEERWKIWGGKPDVVGKDLEKVARGILAISE